MRSSNNSSSSHDDSGGYGLWGIRQFVSTSDGFPFVLQLEDAQVCIDYPASHHHCCWTRAMLHPLWKNFHSIPLKKSEEGEEEKKVVEKNIMLSSNVPQGESCFSIFSLKTQKTLTDIAESIQLLFKRQQQQRPPCGNVSRIRYKHIAPPVVRVGKGIAGTLALTFSLRRSDDTSAAIRNLFPSFLAVEVCDSIASFVTIDVPESKRRPSNTVLLLLQSINEEENVATYSTFDAELNLGTSSPSPSSLNKLTWMFRVYAAFYSSLEAQIRLDEPFMHLWEWKSNVTKEERFAVVNPSMDPDVAFSVERRYRANMERHIRDAISQLDDPMEVDGVSSSSSSSHALPPPTATLRHVATVHTCHPVAMESCIQLGNSTLAAVMPRDIVWPLQLLVSSSGVEGKSWRSPLIPGSSSLQRLAREMSYLEERRTGEEDEESK